MHDLLIIGLGPAGYNAALYASRYKMKVKLIGAQPGGQVSASGEVENYLGYKHILGTELAQIMMEQVKENGSEIVFDTVESITRTDDGFTAKTSFSGEHQGKIVLIATGTKHRKLGAKGEDEFYGRGVTYCATCDGMFYKGKDVAVVGGGNSAAEAALYLADICPSVRVFVRKPHFRADAVLVEKILRHPKITVEFETNVAEIGGEKKMTHIILDNGERRDIEGMFVEIGADPENNLAKQLGVDLDNTGFIIVDRGQRTSVPRVLAAGDNTTGSEKFAQIATAIGEGAIASKSAFEIFQQYA